MRRHILYGVFCACGTATGLGSYYNNIPFFQSCFVSTFLPDGGNNANAAEGGAVSGTPRDPFSVGCSSEKRCDAGTLMRFDGAEEKVLPWSCQSGAPPFRLFAEDRTAIDNNTSRVFSSSTFRSYDVAAIVEDLRMKNVSTSGASGNNSALISSTRPENERSIFDNSMSQGQVTVASVAAATMAATSDVKKPYEHHVSSIFQQPVPQQQQNNNLLNTSHPLVSMRELANKNTSRDDRGGRKAVDAEEQQQKVEDVDANINECDSTVKSSAVGHDTHGEEERVIVRDHMRRTVSVERLTCFREIADKLPQWLQNGIDHAAYVKPTLIQSVAIPLFMERRDVVGVAPTGSGKTVAFALPALAALAASPSSAHGGAGGNSDGGADGVAAVSPCVLVLCPTRELVQQTRDVFLMLAGNAVLVKGTFGGQDRERQLDYLRRGGGCDVLVSTPGRLCDFVDAGCVRLNLINFLIVDEADRMLELGFAPQLEFIMSNVEKHNQPRQTTMWTATWNATVGSLARRFLRDQRVLLEVDREHKTNTNIDQRLYGIRDATQRIQAIVNLYDNGVISKREQVLIFVNRKEEVERLANELGKALRAPPDLIRSLHGGMKQRKREGILHAFKESRIRILCATDVAARGLDVPELAHVINYDLPADTDAYVHRIGRTGRAGRQGTAHTLIVAGDSRVPQITRFIAAQTSTTLSDDVLAIVRDVELHSVATSGRLKYKNHARVAGRDWRVPGDVVPTLAKSSRYIRGVGRVVTLKRPLKE